MDPSWLGERIAGVAALEEPVRRSLYLHVAAQAEDVSREQAAKALGITRSLAGFHLDRLVEEGLLEASFRRLTGRSGPGAGRPAKLYRRSSRQLDLSLPPRSYELAARILVGAAGANPSPEARERLAESARASGRAIGEAARTQAGESPDRERLLATTTAALAATGYEPDRDAEELRLRNCPFHALVAEHKELVCGMNLALVQGLVEGVGLDHAEPHLDPRPGFCCVSVRLAGGAA